MKKFFEVVAKCGHVGKQFYYEGHFFVESNNASCAAKRVRNMPRVKHDHEDAILSVREVPYNIYIIGVHEMETNAYFNCTNSSEQRFHWDEIEPFIMPETEKQMTYRGKHCKSFRRSNNCAARTSKVRGLRNPYKYAKLNFIPSIPGFELDFA